MNNKGISAVVATVLIILITVAAITIIWAAVIPMVKNQISSGTTCLDAVSQVGLVTEGGYTCITEDGKVQLQISRGAKDFDLAGVQVLVSIGGDTSSYDYLNSEHSGKELPDSNEERVISVTNTNLDVTSDNLGKATEVSIAPIVKVGQTTETCDVSATAVLEECA